MFSALSRRWQRQLRSGQSSRPQRRSHGGFRPRLEALEDRYVPSPLTVNSSADNGNLVGTLRYAVAHAQDGDVIDILNGQIIKLSQGELYLSHNVTIEGVGEAKQAIIDGTTDQINFSRIFEVAPRAHVKLVNLGITDGNGVAHNSLGNPSLDGNGGGILNEGALDVINCRLNVDFVPRSLPFHPFHEKFGGGIFNYHGRLAVTDSELSHCYAGAGGGIYNDGGVVAITHCMLDNDKAGGGGAIWNERGVAFVGVNSMLTNNDARGGGAIANDGGEVTVSSSDLSRNTATDFNGGALFNYGGTMTVNFGSIVEHNCAERYGGGIYNEKGMLDVSNASVIDNNAKFGGGIASIRGTAVVLNSDLHFNQATCDGGGIFNFLGRLTVTGSHLDSNAASNRGGGISNLSGTVQVTGSELSLNFSPKGGGISNFQGTLTVGTSLFKHNKLDTILGPYTDLGGNTFN
jgi:hypothetical protein